MAGVMRCSSWDAAAPALSESTIASGLAMGGRALRAPGFAVVQVAAAPPPDPPLTTVQVAGIPEPKLSLSIVPFAGEIVPMGRVNALIQLPCALFTVRLKATLLPQARLVGR